MRVNLFLVGAMKSGTTYLASLLAQHYEFGCPAVKEPCFFADQLVLKYDYIQSYNLKLCSCVKKYHELFEQQHDKKYYIDASTHYTKAPLFSGCAEAIHQYNPNARIIYLIRDPVERMVSHYWNTVKSGLEFNSIDYALITNPHYRDVSDYKLQLEPYISHFERRNIRIIHFHDLINNTSQIMTRLENWLGVDHFSYDFGNVNKNETLDVLRATSALDFIFRTDQWASIRNYFPTNIKEGIKKYLIKELERTNPEKETLEYLTEYFKKKGELSRDKYFFL